MYKPAVQPLLRRRSLRSFRPLPAILLILLILLPFLGPSRPVLAAVTVKPALALKSETAVLMDAASGQVLYAKNMDQKMYPASITKIMTALLTLEQSNLADTITMSADAIYAVDRGSSHIALNVGERISVEDALYALSIASANDAANGLAELVGGSISDFAALMTARAQEIGAVNTHFNNANGLPDNEHYTTAHDMALITRQAIQLPEFLTIFSANYHEIAPSNKQKQTRKLHSANYFLNGVRHLDGVIASKTGYTREARYTLVTIVRRQGRTLLAVVMKSNTKRDKWDDTQKLIDYGFSQFIPVTIACSRLNQSKVACTDDSGNPGTAELTSSGDVTLLLHKSLQPDAISVSYDLPSALTPASAGQVRAVLRVADTNAAVMYPVLAEIPLAVQMKIIAPTSQSPAPETPVSTTPVQSSPSANSGADSHAGLRLFSQILIILGAVVLLLAMVIIYLALHSSRQRRRKSRRLGMAPTRVKFD